MNSTLFFQNKKSKIRIMDVEWIEDYFKHPEKINVHITAAMMNDVANGNGSLHVEHQQHSHQQCSVVFDDMADIYYPARHLNSF